MTTEREQALIDALKEDDVFRLLLAAFAVRMSEDLNWNGADSINDLKGRLNDAATEMNEFLSLFVDKEVPKV